MTTTSQTQQQQHQHQLTDEERQAVVALKEVCDREGIHYENVFQLVKYVLVVHSSVPDDSNDSEDKKKKAFELRLVKALKRLKQRHAWVTKNNIHTINAKEALLELYQVAPEYFVMDYGTDLEGRVVVAHHHAYPPTDYVCHNTLQRAKFLAAEQLRMDLAAADLDEARRGIALVSITDGKLTLARAWTYLKLCAAIAKDNLSDMHQHRIKKVYSQVPSWLVHLVAPAKRLLPQKIAGRIHLCKSMQELHSHVPTTTSRNEEEAVDAANGLSSSSSSKVTLTEWIDVRMKKYQETMENLSL